MPLWGRGCITGTWSGGCTLSVPPTYSQLPLVVSPKEGVRRSSHSKVTAPGVHQDIQLENEEREGGSGLQQETLLRCPPSSAWHRR